MSQLVRRASRILLALSLGCGAALPPVAAQQAGAVNPPQAAAPATATVKPTPPAAPTAAKPAAAKPDKKPHPKLTAKQQQAVSILQAVESDLGRFSPEMQADLLQEMARAYKDLDRAKQVALLKQAFEASANMPDGDARTEQQNSIVRDLDNAEPSALADLRNSPDPKVRETVLRLLIKDDIDRGKLPAAVSLLTQWDPSLAYPYEEAKRAIASLSAQQAGERSSVFASAIATFRTSDEEIDPTNKITDLITGSYSLLPPAMVVDAVDAVLNKARKQEESQQDQQVSLTIGGKNGQANFSNMYDYELFQLLPVLDKLDPAKAEALRRDDANVAALTRKYPNGTSSLNPGTSGMSMMMNVGGKDGPPPAPDPGMMQQMQTAETIMASAEKDPASAIASAQNLDNSAKFEYAFSTSRTRVLDKIATESVRKKDYVTAHTAIQALVSAIQDLPPLIQAHYMARIAALYAEMGDPQTAQQYVSKGMKAADGAYQKDAFADPPNDASKALWPSTAAWKGLLIVSARIDAGHAVRESASLPDPEIEAVANVAIASVLLDQEPGMEPLSISHNGQEQMKMMFDVPWWSVPKGGGSDKTQAEQ